MPKDYLAERSNEILFVSDFTWQAKWTRALSLCRDKHNNGELQNSTDGDEPKQTKRSLQTFTPPVTGPNQLDSYAPLSNALGTAHFTDLFLKPLQTI